MTLSRRSFTFASLFAAMTPSVARAGKRDRAVIPEVEEAAEEQADAEQDFAVKVESRVVADKLEIKFQVTSQLDHAVDVMVGLGSRPAGQVVVHADVAGHVTELARALDEVDRREVMSRMGPMPRFETLKPGATLAMGPFRFVVPEGARAPFSVDADVQTSERPLRVHVDDLMLGGSTLA